MKTETLVRDAVSGAIAGLAAASVMQQFQSASSKVSNAISNGQNGDKQGGDGGESATVKAAEKGSRALTGEELPDRLHSPAGSLVHYGFGAFVGLAYGVAANLFPQIRAGYGTAYGFGVAVFADELLVPAAGLSEPPTETPPSTHLYSLASHLVFGAALEAFRRLVDEAAFPVAEKAVQPSRR